MGRGECVSTAQCLGNRGRGGRSRAAFTLIEVLVVVAIIALLAAILLPSLSRAREQTRITQCASNMKQHVSVCMMYAHDNKGWFPRNPSQHINNAGGSWWVDTVIATYDAQRGPFDLTKLFKNYTQSQMQIFSCPSNGGPSLNDPAIIAAARTREYMGAHCMMFWNSTCVFKGSSPEKPWAPKPEWVAAGNASMVPLVQDQFTAVGGTLLAPDLFYLNHGKTAARGTFPGEVAYLSFKTSPDRRQCTGVNIGYLDGHVAWMRNQFIAGGNKGWSLSIPYSGSATRLGGGISTSGAPLTLKTEVLHP